MWVQTLLSLVGVIGLILFLFYLLKKVNKYSTAASGNKLRILDRAVTGRDSSLIVVSVSGKLMLIGVSVGKIEKLCDLELSEEEYRGTDDTADKPPISFVGVFNNYIANKNAKNEDIHTKTENSKSEGEETNVEAD
ncbi:MAG: flagellar biosynthetic protein FliO [Oscillospiraceae bacterium]|nr:flagellar biosynthetic protein FliO [Oscillospiraceae bacterium]